MKRKAISLLLVMLLLMGFIGISATSALAVDTAPPTVAKTVSPTDINIAGSGNNEETTVTITINGSGGTSTTTTPMDVVFAIDSSGSMLGNDPSGLRLTAAKTFIDKMDAARDQAGVVSWDSVINFSFGLSSNFTAAKAAVDAVDSSGGTNLNVGLNGAIAILDANTRAEPSAEVIIFLTDGQGSYTPSGSPGSPADYAAGQGYTIYSIGLGSADSGPLVDIANTTGGKYYSSVSPENLQDIFDDIYTEVVTSTVPHNVNVTEVTQGYIIGQTSFNILPDSITVDPSTNITTIIWNNIGLLNDGDPDFSADETVQLTFNVKSNQAGSLLPVQVYEDAKVEYTDADGANPGSVAIPQGYINVNTPPDTTGAYADPGCLWPPNHKFADINIMGVTDPDGDPVTISITGITSDEPTASDEGSGGALHTPDAYGIGTDTASVRVERSGDEDGRVYVISFEASDGAGGVSTGQVSVGVPHDQSGDECSAVDSGQNYDATVDN